MKKNPKKSLNSEKKLKRGTTLCDFSTSILSQNIKKLKGGPFGEFFKKKKSHNAEKKLKEGPFSLSRYGMFRGKTEKTFLVQFARPNDSIWDHKILQNF